MDPTLLCGSKQTPITMIAGGHSPRLFWPSIYTGSRCFHGSLLFFVLFVQGARRAALSALSSPASPHASRRASRTGRRDEASHEHGREEHGQQLTRDFVRLDHGARVSLSATRLCVSPSQRIEG